MDYIGDLDIRLEKEYYYAGEEIRGSVFLETLENFKLKSVRAILRGQAHAEWKVILSGERKTVKDDEYFIDKKLFLYDSDKENSATFKRGHHKLPFEFKIPESSLPCSFESQTCSIRYYIRVVLEIPYTTSLQGVKYFTIIGPYVDCMDPQYLRPSVAVDKNSPCLCWWKKETVTLRCVLERSAYTCNESVKLKATIDNRGPDEVQLRVRLMQMCEFYVTRGVLRGANRELKQLVFEYTGTCVKPNSRIKWDSANSLVLPTMPTTLVGICRFVQIHYILSVSLDSEKETNIVKVHFPVTIGTVPFRIPNSSKTPVIRYEHASSLVEGGKYIGPQFLMDQVYDGTDTNREDVVLYRPVYVTVGRPEKRDSKTPAPT